MASQRTAIVVARPGGTNAPAGRVDDFLDHFAAQEAERRISTRPAPLSVDEHAEHRKQLEGVFFVRPNYSKSTRINVGGMQGKWQR